MVHISKKNHTRKLTNPVSIINKMPSTQWVPLSFSQIPAATETQAQSNYVDASAFSKLILPSPSLGTRPQSTSKDHTRNVLTLLSRTTLAQRTSENKLIRIQTGLESVRTLRIWTTCS